MAKLRTIAPLVRTLDTRTTRPPPRQTDPIYNTPEFQAWRAQVVARADGQCEAVDHHGHRCSKATTSLSFVMVVNHLISTMVSAYAHRITSLRRSRLELDGLEAEMTGGLRKSQVSPLYKRMPPHAGILRARMKNSRNPGRQGATYCGRLGGNPNLICRNDNLEMIPMANEAATGLGKPRPKGGRPTRAEATAKALAVLAIDPRTVDPLAVLAGIMVDVSLPASARVQAARALIAARDQRPAEDSAAGSDVAARAIRLMAAARKAH
jgi:hypothetical protein